MQDSTLSIPWWRLLIMLPPFTVMLVLLFRWTDQGKSLLHASARMAGQLALIGYVLVWVFRTDNPAWVVLALSLMAAAAGWIALRPLAEKSAKLYLRSLATILLCGGSTLALAVWGVLQPPLWYDPRVVIPLAGMIFASSMNQISLSAERYLAERARHLDHPTARAIAIRASLIPLLNTFFAVGLVQLPGMMTGQILAGADPLIAVRYQILVMLMLLSSGGLAAALFVQSLASHPIATLPLPESQSVR